MPSKYGILCILLSFIVLILGYENIANLSSPSVVTPPKQSGKKGDPKPESAPPAGAPKDSPPRDAFNVIAEKNVFNPERKEFSAMAAAAMGRPVSRPQITLYGVVMAEEYQTASIVNPGRPLHKGERETKTVKIGDTVGDYKLTKIMPDRIVFEAGEDSFEVLLYDPRAPKRRAEGKTPTQPAMVTSTVPGATSPGIPPAVPPTGATSPAVTTSPGGIAPPSTMQPYPAARSVTPLSPPRIPGSAPEGAYQVPTPSAPTAPAAVPDPGVWRGRRPVTPGVPPG